MLLYRRYNSILAHGAAPEVQAVGKYKIKDEATAVAAIMEIIKRSRGCAPQTLRVALGLSLLMKFRDG